MPVADDQIPRLGFRPPAVHVPGFEIIDLTTLHRRRKRHGPEAVHRIDFHTLTLITAGSGEHTIDFVADPCRPGTLLWVRPGQVQCFDPAAATDGTHLLFTPRSPRPPATPSAWPVPDMVRLLATRYKPRLRDRGHPAGPDARRIRPPAGTVAPEILQLLLGALLLHIDRLPPPAGSLDPRAGGEVYARFRAALERSYPDTRRAHDYARRLGYTVKTLTRTCLVATGQPAKQVIDARVALEARRLLAHTDDPVAAIAGRPGFTEPTNFGIFYTRHTGTTPGDFRRTHRASR